MTIAKLYFNYCSLQFFIAQINTSHLEMVTENFTRDETRRNCAKVKRLIVKSCIVYPKVVYDYFPLLSV